MILISHRGNINGKNTKEENHPDYIDKAIELGYDVEVDVWVKNNLIYLGHDSPDILIPIQWLTDRYSKLWIHCKNTEALVYLKEKESLNVFWHEEDTVTLTSKSYIWAYPGKQPIEKSIAVMPELHSDDLSKCIGVCSDYVKNYTL